MRRRLLRVVAVLFGLYHGAKLVLLSPYTSMADMAALALPLLPGRYLVRDRFDTWSKARDVRVPVLIIHGTDDDRWP